MSSKHYTGKLKPLIERLEAKLERKKLESWPGAKSSDHNHMSLQIHTNRMNTSNV